MKGWHFTSDALRNGDPVPPDGFTLKYKGELVMCESGLYFSRRIIDALLYAPGNIICSVKVEGEILHDTNKGVSSERTILWRIDGEQILRKFARMCALDVIHLWDEDVPKIVVKYLKTGDEKIRAASADASIAARNAANAAANIAARNAANAADWAAKATVSTATSAAAEAAASAAAWAAASDTETATRIARNAAANAISGLAEDAAENANEDDAWVVAEVESVKQNRRLTRMVNYHRKRKGNR